MHGGRHKCEPNIKSRIKNYHEVCAHRLEGLHGGGTGPRCEKKKTRKPGREDRTVVGVAVDGA